MKILLPINIMLMRIVSGIMDLWSSVHDGSYILNIPDVFTLVKLKTSVCVQKILHFYLTRNQTCFCLNGSSVLHPCTTRSQVKGCFLYSEHLRYVSHVYVTIEV